MPRKVLNKTNRREFVWHWGKRAALLLTVCVSAACAVTWHCAKIPLNNVFASVWDGERFYGMDRSGGNILVFASDRDGKNCQIVYVTRSGDKTFRIGEKLSFTEDGQCQATFSEYTGSADMKRYTGICDFETGSLVDVREETDHIEKVPEGVYQSARTEDGKVWYVDREGSVWRSRDKGEGDCVFSNNGAVLGKENTAYVFGKKGIYFYNVGEQAVYQIPYEEPGLVKTELISGYDAERFGFLYQMDEMENGAFTMSFRQPDARLLPAVVGEASAKTGNVLPGDAGNPLPAGTDDKIPAKEGELLSVITPAFKVLALQTFKLSLLLYGAVLALWGMYRLVLLLFKNIFPTSIKLVCFAVPVAAAGWHVLDLQLTEILSAQMVKQEESRMYGGGETLAGLVSEEKLFHERADLYQGFLMLISEYYDETMDTGQVVTVEGQTAGMISPRENNYDLFVKNKENFYMLEPHMLSCIPAEFAYGSQAARLMAECAREREPMIFFQNDVLEGRNLTLYMPVLDEENQVRGILRGMVSQRRILEDIQGQKNQILTWILAFLAAILTILTANAGISLFPLIRLQRSVKHMAEGKEGTAEKVRGNGEVAQVIRFFTRMSESVAAYLKRVNRLKNAYEPFVPESLIQIFGEKDIRDIEPGKETQKEAVILILESQQFKQEKKQEDSDPFLILNKIYCGINAAVEEGPGIVEQFTDAGAVVLFESGMEDALKTAKRAFEKLGGRYFFGAGMVYGSLRFGVIGTLDRMEVMTISPHLRLAGLLNQLSCQYQAGVLMTGEAAKMAIQATGGKGIRLFGYLQTEPHLGNKEAVYEYFSPLGSEQESLRTASKEDFEEGIRCMEEKRFLEGRTLFVRVLQANRDDLAAGHYFRVCDGGMEGKQYMGIYCDFETGKDGIWSEGS